MKEPRTESLTAKFTFSERKLIEDFAHKHSRPNSEVIRSATLLYLSIAGENLPFIDRMVDIVKRAHEAAQQAFVSASTLGDLKKEAQQLEKERPNGV